VSAHRWSGRAPYSGTRPLRSRPLQLVIVRDLAGHQHDDFFITSDIDIAPAEVASLYSDRWAIEDTNRSLEQYLGVRGGKTCPVPQEGRPGHSRERERELVKRDLARAITPPSTQAVSTPPSPAPMKTGRGPMAWTSSPPSTYETPAAIPTEPKTFANTRPWMAGET